jgi:hypothetical protein
MSFRPTQQVIFTNTDATPNPATYSWVCPPDVKFINLTMIGAGGGGGGGGGGGIGNTVSSSTYHAGGGGAAGCAGLSGQCNFIQSLPVTPGYTYGISVGNYGTGGAAGTSATAGSDGLLGGDTTFTYPNATVLTASGGAGGLGGYQGNNSGASADGGTSTAQSAPGYGLITDGSQVGLASGSNQTGSGSGNTAFQIYQIYTDVSNPLGTNNNAVTPSNSPYYNSGVYGPFGEAPAGMITGNAVLDINPGGSYTLDGVNYYDIAGSSATGANVTDFTLTSHGGGAGGILKLQSLIPIYFIGIDFSTFSLPIVLPYIYSYEGVGLGDGGTATTSALNLVSHPGKAPNYLAPTSQSIGFWSNGIATKIGYGAGGLGGPGGGGGAYGSTGGAAAGGSGYGGDQGLPGMLMISWS